MSHRLLIEGLSKSYRGRQVIRDISLDVSGGEVVGLPFIVELEFLNGRERLAGHDVFSLIHY